MGEGARGEGCWGGGGLTVDVDAVVDGYMVSDLWCFWPLGRFVSVALVGFDSAGG